MRCTSRPCRSCHISHFVLLFQPHIFHRCRILVAKVFPALPDPPAASYSSKRHLTCLPFPPAFPCPLPPVSSIFLLSSLIHFTTSRLPSSELFLCSAPAVANFVPSPLSCRPNPAAFSLFLSSFPLHCSTSPHPFPQLTLHLLPPFAVSCSPPSDLVPLSFLQWSVLLPVSSMMFALASISYFLHLLPARLVLPLLSSPAFPPFNQVLVLVSTLVYSVSRELHQYPHRFDPLSVVPLPGLVSPWSSSRLPLPNFESSPVVLYPSRSTPFSLSPPSLFSGLLVSAHPTNLPCPPALPPCHLTHRIPPLPIVP